MLKRRVGAAVLLLNDLVVQSSHFDKYLPIGRASIVVEFLNQWGIDEIFLLDISASREDRVISAEIVFNSAKKCFVPLAVGGGITSLEQVDILLQSGADKVVLDTILLKRKNFIKEVAYKYGNQFTVASIDVYERSKNQYMVYDHASGQPTSLNPMEWAQTLAGLGAGEIMVNQVNRDGSYIGFDIDFLRPFCQHVSLPVIALGGAGNPHHFKEAFDVTNVSALCAGNYFNFIEHSVIVVKQYLKKNGIDVRLETQANYMESNLNDEFRPQKRSDKQLEEMLYVKIDKEII